MNKCDFIGAQTSAHALDMVSGDLAGIIAALILRCTEALQSKEAMEKSSSQLAAICEADAEFYNHVGHELIKVMTKCCPDVDLARYLHSCLAKEEVAH